MVIMFKTTISTRSIHKTNTCSNWVNEGDFVRLARLGSSLLWNPNINIIYSKKHEIKNKFVKFPHLFYGEEKSIQNGLMHVDTKSTCGISNSQPVNEFIYT